MTVLPSGGFTTVAILNPPDGKWKIHLCALAKENLKNSSLPPSSWPLVTVYILADSGFFKKFLYQGGVKFTVFWVFEDLKFKILEDYKQN